MTRVPEQVLRLKKLLDDNVPLDDYPAEDLTSVIGVAGFILDGALRLRGPAGTYMSSAGWKIGAMVLEESEQRKPNRLPTPSREEAWKVLKSTVEEIIKERIEL